MTFWFILVVSYSLEFDSGERLEFRIPFNNYHSCIAAQDQIHAAIYQNYRDIHSSCVETDVASKSIRPKLRPKHLEKDK